MFGATPVEVPFAYDGKRFSVDMDAVAAALTDKTRLLLYTSPSNPLGWVATQAEQQALLDFCRRHGLWLLADEVYERLYYQGEVAPSILRLCTRDDAVIVVQSFSKTYCMTGWRLGYAAGPQEVIAAMDAYQSHAAGNPNTLAQYAGLAALEESGLAQDIVAAFAARRDMMLAALDTLPQVTFFPPQGAFYVLVDISALIGKHYQGKVISDDTVFAEMLLEEAGVSVVPGGAFYAPGTCRLSYAISEERMSEAIRRIGVFISQIS